MRYLSKGHNDCALVAIAAYCNLPYDKVKGMSNYHPDHGTDTDGLLSTLNMVQRPFPTGWQEWQVAHGILRLWQPSSNRGHAAVLQPGGMVHDALFPQGLALNDYLRARHMELVGLWVRWDEWWKLQQPA